MDDVAASQEKKRVHVTNACERCRQHKAKCDGNDPCDKCSQSNSQCTYTPRAGDKRFRGNRPTTTQLSDLHHHQQVLNYLWQAILDGREQDILHRIRSGASIRDVADQINGVFTIGQPQPGDDASKMVSNDPIRPGGDSALPASCSISFPIELSLRNDHLGGDIPATSHTPPRPLKRSYPPHLSSEEDLTLGLHQENSSQSGSSGPASSSTGTPNREQHESFRRRFCIPSKSFGNLPFSASITANHYPVATQDAQRQLFIRPEWQILPHSTESSDSPLDSAFTSFRRAAAQIPSSSSSHSTWLHHGLALIDATLLFRERRPDDPLTAEAWASEFCRTFPIPWCIKLAAVYTSTRLMQWMLDPTPQTYAALPEMMRPTSRQRMIPHAPAIDAIPSPLLRDALIETPRDFVMPGIKAGCHVSWLFSLNEALIAVRRTDGDPSSSETSILLSPEFCAHVGQAKNWKVGKKILNDCPELHRDPCVSATQDTLTSPSYWL